MENIRKFVTDAEPIISLCEERVAKRGLSKCGSCKGCPYRYRGEDNTLLCCSFAVLPLDWRTYYNV